MGRMSLMGKGNKAEVIERTRFKLELRIDALAPPVRGDYQIW